MRKLFLVCACVALFAACCNNTTDEGICTNDTIICDTVANDTVAVSDSVCTAVEDSLATEE